MNEKLAYILGGRLSREDLLSFIDNNPHELENIVKIALSNDNPFCWRAAWMINLTISKNDERIKIYIPEIVKALLDKENGHQRELLKILESVDINENEEGYLFDACLGIWQAVDKSPSVRITAFKIISKMALKYPELRSEIEPLTQKHFTDTLSPGIKNTFDRLKFRIISKL